MITSSNAGDTTAVPLTATTGLVGLFDLDVVLRLSGSYGWRHGEKPQQESGKENAHGKAPVRWGKWVLA
jgi:hypothetical protein